MRTNRIACIGSRETSTPILDWMEVLGADLVKAGYVIVSGNAPGADQAWARGGNAVDPTKVELCLPWENFESSAIHGRNAVRVFNMVKSNGYVEAVRATHPNFGRLTSGAVRLHARNAMIVENVHVVLGSLNPDKPGGGGTGSAFRIAQRNKIITLNVADALIRRGIEHRLKNLLDVRGPTFELSRGKRW